MYTKFGNNIMNYRKQNGLTQEDFAALIVDRQLENSKRDYSKSVSKWERGESYPEMKTLILIAQELDVTLDELVNVEIESYGISPEMAKEIENMESWDLTYLVRLYERSVLHHCGDHNCFMSLIVLERLSEDDENIKFIDSLQFANGASGIRIKKGDIIENLKYNLEDVFEDLLNSSFVVADLDFKFVKEDEDRYTVCIYLLADRNVIKALIDENARKNKMEIKRKFDAKSM
ncbi:MAG: helix-turn-helix transcriptional regulator [Bacillota bacterium]